MNPSKYDAVYFIYLFIIYLLLKLKNPANALTPDLTMESAVLGVVLLGPI